MRTDYPYTSFPVHPPPTSIGPGLLLTEQAVRQYENKFQVDWYNILRRPTDFQGIPWVNVKDGPFNAKGDGVTDDTDAFEGAIAAGIRDIVIPDGDYLITRTLELGFGQVLHGASRGMSIGGPGARLVFRPTDGSIAAVANAPGAQAVVIEDLAIDLVDDTHMGIRWVSGSYSVARRVQFAGRYDIGLYVYDSYVCDIDQVSNSGSTPKRAIVYINLSNGTVIRHLHTSSLPADPTVPMVGIEILGGKGYTIDTPVLQGPTIGISLAQTTNVVIINPYFENCVCDIRAGDPTTSSATQATTVIGGNYSSPYSSHPQYAARGPLVYLPRADRVALQNPKFLDAHAEDASIWPILTTFTSGQLSVYDGHWFSSNVRDEIFRDSTSASPRLTIAGAQYGSFGGTEIVLKADGTFGGNCFGLRVDNAGTLSTTAYTPAVISGVVDPLLTGAIPNILP